MASFENAMHSYIDRDTKFPHDMLIHPRAQSQVSSKVSLKKQKRKLLDTIL